MIGYEIIDHTADVGVKVEAESLEGLFLDCAHAMFEILVESKPDLIPSITIPVTVELASEKEELSTERLLVKWLQELLYIYETRHIVPLQFYIDELTDHSVEGCMKGLKFDRARHKVVGQIKAVTYHQLRVLSEGGKWKTQIIFDI